MRPPEDGLRRENLPSWAVGILVLLTITLALVRIFLPARSLDALGPTALLDATSTLGLLLLFLFIAAGLGIEFLRRLFFPDLDLLDQLVFGLPIGLGLFSLTFFALGALGLLKPAAIAAIILVLGLLSVRSWWRLWVDGLLAVSEHLSGWRKSSLHLRIGVLMSLALLALVLRRVDVPSRSSATLP